MATNGGGDSSPLLEEVPCPICGTTQCRLVHTVRDRLSGHNVQFKGEPQENTYSIVACSSCGLLHLNPRPRLADLSHYYQSESYDPHRRRGGGMVGFLYRFLRPLSVNFKVAKVAHGRTTGCVLDIGCGTGEFLLAMKRRGWEVLGIERDPEAAGRAQALGCPMIMGDPREVSLPEANFDLITFWHALEHLPDLKGVLSRILAKLKPGGLLAIALPNPESLDARYYGSNWVAWDAPRHLYHFRLQDLQKLLHPHGLVWWKCHALPLDPFYNALLSEVSWARGFRKALGVSRGLILGICSYAAGMKPEKGSSVLYLFRKG